MSATATERFQIMAENHGPLESPIADRLLAHIMETAISRYYGHRTGTLADFVTGQLKTQAADILAVLELAADWSKDPVSAAGRLLRTDLDADARRRAEELERDKQAAIEAAVQDAADRFKATLKVEGPTLSGSNRQGATAKAQAVSALAHVGPASAKG